MVLLPLLVMSLLLLMLLSLLLAVFTIAKTKVLLVERIGYYCALLAPVYAKYCWEYFGLGIL
jgi:hypothetical protein